MPTAFVADQNRGFATDMDIVEFDVQALRQCVEPPKCSMSWRVMINRHQNGLDRLMAACLRVDE